MSDSLIPEDDVKAALRSDQALDVIVDQWGLDEALLAFAALASDIQTQLDQKINPDRRWRKSAGFVLARTNARQNLLKNLIKERNKAETATVDAVSRKYTSFAEDLARALYLIDPAALAAVPGPEGINSVEWLHWRVERAARREQKTEGQS